MEPITLTANGIQFTLKDIHKNKAIPCSCEGYSDKGFCDWKKELLLAPSRTTLTLTEVIFNAKNSSNKGWRLDQSNWKLVDTDGYAYEAKDFCPDRRPPRMTETYHEVSSMTLADFALAFPELEVGKEVASILYSVGDTTLLRFDVNPLRLEALDVFQKVSEAGSGRLGASGQEQGLGTSQTTTIADIEARGVGRTLDRLEELVHTRLYDALTPREVTNLENEIRRTRFRIEQQMRGLSESANAGLSIRLESILEAFDSQLDIVEDKEREARTLDKKVAQLYELSPREFEEYIAELFQALGYENVRLTSAINDSGIDILAERKGMRVAIQCKRYKGKVGSPEVQAFLGAMRHIEAGKGFLVTTGVFSIEAERMTSNQPIELIDGATLGTLIREALHKE